MRKFLITVIFCFFMVLPVRGLEIQAPKVPDSAESVMPSDTSTFAEGCFHLLGKALEIIRPELLDAAKTGVRLTASVMLISVLHLFSEPLKLVSSAVGTCAVAGMLMTETQSMIRLATQTIYDISSYAKLLMPVMTSAMAAQGSLAASSALYAGASFFNALMTGMIADYLVPLVYVFLALSIANSAVGEDMLKKISQLARDTVSWLLKISLMVFTTFLSVTGIVSGTADAAALKAAKVTISTVVPVVGGILSDASEAVLVSAGLLKNAAGLYGIFAAASILLEPFLLIGAHYLVLKFTGALCGIFAAKRISDLISDFSTAMGLLLGMTGAVCLILLISTVCFMKGLS